MKIYALYIYRQNNDKATLIDSAKEFSDIGFMYRKNAIELADFASSQLATSKNTQSFMSAKEKNLMFHMYRKGEAAVIAVVSEDYPSRVAYSILKEIMGEFDQCSGRYPGGKSEVIKRGIVQYQEPKNADKLLQIQSNLDEAKEIMIMNLEKAIGRGEKLSELAEKSETLSEQSKMFAREAEKMSSCCVVI